MLVPHLEIRVIRHSEQVLVYQLWIVDQFIYKFTLSSIIQQLPGHINDEFHLITSYKISWIHNTNLNNRLTTLNQFDIWYQCTILILQNGIILPIIICKFILLVHLSLLPTDCFHSYASGFKQYQIGFLQWLKNCEHKCITYMV